MAHRHLATGYFAAIAILLLMGFILPWLFSQPSNITVTAGFIILLVLGYVPVYFLNHWFTEYKKKKGQVARVIDIKKGDNNEG
jgi:hypothetical protein